MVPQEIIHNEASKVIQTHIPSLEVIPANFHKNRQIVLVTMYQFLNVHGSKACLKLLV